MIKIGEIEYNFKDFINIKEHNNKLAVNIQTLKNDSSKGSSGKQYLDVLTDFFLQDIKVSAEMAYEKSHIKSNKGSLKIELPRLRKCVEEGVIKEFLPNYEFHMSNFTGTGIGVYSGDLQDYKKAFIERVSGTLEYQCDLLDKKYRDNSEKNCRESWGLWTQWIGIIVAITIPIVVVFLKK